LPGVYSNTLVFTAVPNYVPEPTVVSVSPNPAVAGGTVTIAGTNFYGLSGASSAVIDVTIGGTACTSFAVVDDALLSCVIPSLADGTYQIVVNTTTGTSNNDIAVNITTSTYPTMQAFNTASCSAMPIFYPAASPPAGSEVNLLDTRNMKVYKVRKLPSNTAGTTGWCWIVDNFSLAPAPANPDVLILDSVNSDMSSGTYVLTAANIMDPNTAGSYCGNLSTATYPHRCGMQYSYYAATAGTDATLTTGNAPNSICPKNWRLPTGEPTTGDFTVLTAALGWTNGSHVNSLNGFRGLYAGYNITANQGTGGYYWPSTTQTYLTAYILNFTSSGVYPSATWTNVKANNLSLRCLTR